MRWNIDIVSRNEKVIQKNIYEYQIFSQKRLSSWISCIYRLWPFILKYSIIYTFKSVSKNDTYGTKSTVPDGFLTINVFIFCDFRGQNILQILNSNKKWQTYKPKVTNKYSQSQAMGPKFCLTVPQSGLIHWSEISKCSSDLNSFILIAKLCSTLSCNVFINTNENNCFQFLNLFSWCHLRKALR